MGTEVSENRIALIGCFLLMLAFTICHLPNAPLRFVIDYSELKEVHFKVNKEKKLTAEVKFAQGVKESLAFAEKKLHLPFKLSSERVFFAAFVLCYFYIAVARKIFDYSDAEESLLAIVLALVVLVVVFWINLIFDWLVIKDHYEGAINSVFETPVGTKEILAAVKSEIETNFTGVPLLISILAMVASAIAYAIMHLDSMLRFKGWIARSVFLFLLRNNKDMVVSEVVRADRDEFEKAAEQAREGVLNGAEIVQIADDGSVELVRYDCRVNWRPFPMLKVAKNGLKKLTFDNFFRLLMTDVKESAFSELREKLLQRERERFKGLAGEESIDLTLGALKRNLISSLKRKVADSLAEQKEVNAERTANAMKRAYTLAIRNYRDDLANVGFERLQSFIGELEAGIKERVGQACDQINSLDGGSLEVPDALLPPNVKLYMERGNRKIYVFEEAPQRRSIHVTRALNNKINGCRFYLAFPYVVFIVVLKNGRYQRLRVFYNNKPLADAGDSVYYPNLPNTRENAEICMDVEHEASGSSQRALEVVTRYWSGVFNSDLCGWYEEYQAKDKRLKNFAEWEANSEKDPCFFLSVPLISAGRLADILRKELDEIGGEEMIGKGETIGRIEQAFAAQKGFSSELKRLLVAGKYVESGQPVAQKVLEEYFNQVCGHFSDMIVAAAQGASEAAMVREDLYERIMGSVGAVLEEDFSELMSQVLLRRKIEAGQLIELIKE